MTTTDHALVTPHEIAHDIAVRILERENTALVPKNAAYLISRFEAEISAALTAHKPGEWQTASQGYDKAIEQAVRDVIFDGSFPWHSGTVIDMDLLEQLCVTLVHAIRLTGKA